MKNSMGRDIANCSIGKKEPKDFTLDQLMEQIIMTLFDYKAVPGGQGNRDFILYLVNEFLLMSAKTNRKLNNKNHEKISKIY